jgi:hypothetical protein
LESRFFREFEPIFEPALDHQSGDQVGSIFKTSFLKKKFPQVPLRKKRVRGRAESYKGSQYKRIQMTTFLQNSFFPGPTQKKEKDRKLV